MSGFAVIGCTVGGAGLGFLLGAWHGFATDTSDFPMAAAFEAPIGALIGALVGVIAGTVIFG